MVDRRPRKVYLLAQSGLRQNVIARLLQPDGAGIPCLTALVMVINTLVSTTRLAFPKSRAGSTGRCNTGLEEMVGHRAASFS